MPRPRPESAPAGPPGPAAPRRPRVAVLVESSNAYGRGLLRGVASHVRTHGGWTIELPELGRGDPAPDWLADWRGDGILARLENERIAEAVVAAGVPTVDLSAGRLVPELPWVEVDEPEVGRLAAAHLRERGFEHLAYCGDDRFPWSRLRGEAFVRAARASARSVEVLPACADLDRSALEAWLRDRPRPLGVFACYDRLGRQVLDACRALGAPVPEQVAVLGADDDELVCGLADPPLSSIALNAHAAGRRAAELLSDAMAGRPVAAEGHFVRPVGVTLRRSTDVLAIDDPVLARALHFIHHHADDGIRVADVQRVAGASRRLLESRFRAKLGCTPHQAVIRARMARIRTLLLETDLTIARIAERTGYRHVEYLTVAFKREHGRTPTAFRAESR
jgi:LacI family transcriptional regulator